MSESDFHVVEHQLNQEEYRRAEVVANLGGAFGIFGDESTEEVIKRIFLSGLAAVEFTVLGKCENNNMGTVQEAMMKELAKNFPEPPPELIAKYKKQKL